MAVLAVGAVGCSGAGDSATSATRAASGAGSSAADGEAPKTGGAEARSAASLVSGKAQAGTQAAEGRDVVSTGSLTVRASDAEAAADDARRIAVDAGGYLAKQDAVLGEEQRAEVTLRVPAESFDEVMADVADLGTVQSRKDDANDVTDQVVDLEGRLENAQVSAKRLRELLAVAENVNNIITIEERLTQREAEIEGITGQLEVLRDEVDLATVRATFTESAPPAVSDDLPGPVEALEAGAVTLANGAKVALAGAAFVLPFVPLLLLAWWVVRWTRRRRGSESALGTAGGAPVA